MALGLRETRFQRQRRRRSRVVWTLILLTLLGGSAFVIYQAGGERARADSLDLERRVTSLTDENAGLTQELQRQTVAANEASAREAEIRQRYDRDVASGTLKQMLDLVSERLDSGIPSQRLAEVIRTASVRPECEDKPTVKRFLPRLRTGNSTEGNTLSTFFDRAVTVIAEGEPAYSDGRPRSWFNPGKPVKVKFNVVGGTVSETTGELPLDHVFTYGKTEYRFSLVHTGNGWIQITGDRCKAP